MAGKGAGDKPPEAPADQRHRRSLTRDYLIDARAEAIEDVGPDRHVTAEAPTIGAIPRLLEHTAQHRRAGVAGEQAGQDNHRPAVARPARGEHIFGGASAQPIRDDTCLAEIVAQGRRAGHRLEVGMVARQIQGDNLITK